jgi:coatomer protein complex subunit gamma
MSGKWDSLKEKIATAVKANLKVEERELVNPWASQDKAAVLQQTKVKLAATPIDAHACLELCTRVLYLLQQGETFSPKELTELFFSVTKLFQCSNARLRRMVYLLIKDLEPSETEVFIAMSMLIKDMNSNNDSFRANSIRVLSRILDPAMAAQIDRYLKTAIVDKNPFVCSSALVCGITLMKAAPDVVRRWVSEVQETVNSKHAMVQFHALALIYELKKNDRLALHKVVMSMAKSSNKSPMAECLLIRYATNTLMSERDATVEKTLMIYLDSCLRHKSEMVTYEAARAFCQLVVGDTEGSGSTVFGYDITHATTILQIFLTSPKPVIRFGAIRTLNLLAQHRSHLAARCNCDMEPLLTDQNRNTATLALTTLLKTGHESNVERLVKQITSFMSEISDAFKIEVVRAVKHLALQYPGKYKTLMGFLASNLREDGTLDFKKDLVDAIILIVGQVPAAREAGLLHLCEYIEDCEFPGLCSRVLAFLADEVPSTAQPSKFIRFIYNRLILENALVRAAAVDALAKIAMKCPSLRSDILLLLQFGENDNDDEVRDRIGLYVGVLRKAMNEEKGNAAIGFPALVSAEMPFSLDAMYDGLLEHISSADTKETPFNFQALPTDESYKATMKAQAALNMDKKKSALPVAPGVKAAQEAAATPQRQAEEQAAQKTELLRVLGEMIPPAELGALQHSCKPKNLTESEAEYTVQCIKHMFKDFVCLEMYVTNTVPGISLEKIEARLTGVSGAWQEAGAAAISKLDNGQNGSAYIMLRKVGANEENAGALTGNFECALHFTCKEEGDDLGYEDDYPIERVKITVGDFIYPKALPAGQHKSLFEQLASQGHETQAKLSLNFKTLEQAVDYLIGALNMEPCDKSQKVEDSRGLSLLLSGTFVGGNMALVKCLVGMVPNQNIIACRITCRAKSAAVCNVVANSLS